MIDRDGPGNNTSRYVMDGSLFGLAIETVVSQRTLVSIFMCSLFYLSVLMPTLHMLYEAPHN